LHAQEIATCQILGGRSYLKPFAAINVASRFISILGTLCPAHCESSSWSLEQSIREYSQLISSFEADHVRLIRLQAGADEKVALRLSEALAANQRGLELIHQALERVRAQLDQERSGPD
jgi:hypothetical protein